MAFPANPSPQSAWRRVWGIFLAWLLLGSAMPLKAGEREEVLDLVREVLSMIVEHGLREETRPVIVQKAWVGLLLELGRADLAAKHDFTILAGVEAEDGFVDAVLSLAQQPGQRRSFRELAESALQIYCRQHDPYTRYIRSEEYKHIRLMSQGGSSVGMSINERDGAFYCFPMPGSPADKGGVKAGDRLFAVDGKSIDGRPLEYIASLIRGAAGSPVQLKVEHSFGRSEVVTIIRETVAMPPVTVEKKITGYVLRVRHFNPGLIAATRTALAPLQATDSLTIDLRGCAGGILDTAMEFASLFLDAGEPIVTVRKRQHEDEVNTAPGPAAFKPAALVLLQDGGTASAAEMVIAALLHSKTQRAASQGPKTFGKGVMQSRFELKGGGALTITNAELIAPQGRTWEGSGLLSSLENQGKIFPELVAP